MIRPDKRKLAHQQIFHLLIISIAFFIPVYGRILPFLIVLLILNWLIEGNYIRTFPLIFKERNRGVLASFLLLYLLYCLGLFHSSNMTYGWFDLEVKLSLFIFPLIFATSEPFFRERKKTTVILVSYIAGCLTTTMLLYGHSIYTMLSGQRENTFFYTELSWFNHPSYLAMYLAFAIAILTFWLTEGYRMFNRYQISLTLILIINFFIFIVLLNSKAGILSVVIVAVLQAHFLVVYRRNLILGAGTLVITVSLFFLCFTLFPNSGERLKQAGMELQSGDARDNDPKSTGERIAIWKSAVQIIRDHPVFGVGTGDVKDALMEQYKANSQTKVLDQKLNAHNQYIQTFISLGIIGIIALVYVLAYPAIRSFRQEYYIYFIFLVIFSFNILVESMFEVQAGVIFYAAFNALLYASCRPDPSGNPFDILVRKV
ncbi:MAG: O-antigen ligase family protein [Bacteroidales bacterium]|nr:O-antigen ligase family protein [Bacteroidales bacterium]